MCDFNLITDIEDILWATEFEELPNPGQPIPSKSSRGDGGHQPVSKRFQTVIDEGEICRFIEGQNNETTKRKTESNMKLFHEFCASQNVFYAAEDLSPVS